jgi:multiple sugar transport system permease protein
MQINKSGTKKTRIKSENFFAYMRKHSASYILIAPFMILFLIFTVVPVLVAVFLSFTNFDMLQMPKFVGLINYKRMFLQDPIFLTVVKNTIVFAFVTGPLSYIMAFLFAWLINELSPKLRTLMTFIFYAPVLSGSATFIWLFIFSGDSYGILNGMLLSIGVFKEPMQWLSNEKTMIVVLVIVQLWASLGVGFLAFIAGFQSMDKSLFEASAIDGIKNRWQELWFITIPSMAPQLLFAAVMQISASFGVGSIIQQLAGFPTTQYKGDTVITYMLDVGTVRYEMGYATSIAVFLIILMLITNQLIQNALRKYSSD